MPGARRLQGWESLVAAGLTVEDVVEPTWPDHNKSDWGGWSPTRGKVIPGTAIYLATKP